MTAAGGKGNTVHENNDLILQKSFLNPITDRSSFPI